MKFRAQSTSPSGLDLVLPKGIEYAWTVVGVVLLVFVVAALISAVRREQWGWVVACVLFPPAAPFYFLTGAARQG
jgi:hypothetical protein